MLLLDEPLSALDKKMREQMQHELRRLQRQVGITFILVTHDQEEALIMSDRIAVMFEGAHRPGGDAARPLSSPGKPPGGGIHRHDELPARRAVATARSESRGSRARPDRGRSAAPGPAPGEVTVGLRPETLAILFEGETADRTAAGEVVERAYYGDMTTYGVLIDGAAEPVWISMENLEGRRVLEPGDGRWCRGIRARWCSSPADRHVSGGISPSPRR